MRYVSLANRPDDKGGVLSGRATLLEIIKQPTGGMGRGVGITVEDMRRDIRLLDAIEAAEDGGTVALEDADWSHLKRKVEAFPFAFSDKRILDLCEDVFNAPQTAEKGR